MAYEPWLSLNTRQDEQFVETRKVKGFKFGSCRNSAGNGYEAPVNSSMNCIKEAYSDYLLADLASENDFTVG